MQEYAGEAKQNPQVAAIALAASLNPNLKVVSKDAANGKITIKNKQTGEVTTLDLSTKNLEEMQKTMEQFAKGLEVPPPTGSNPTARQSAVVQAESEDQPAPVVPAAEGTSSDRAAEQASTVRPDFIPVYPGCNPLNNTVNFLGGNSIGNYTFSTGDSPGTVVDFYEKAFTDAGLSVLSKQNGSNKNGPTASLLANRAGPQTMVTLVAETDSGKTRVAIGFTRAGGN